MQYFPHCVKSKRSGKLHFETKVSHRPLKAAEEGNESFINREEQQAIKDRNLRAEKKKAMIPFMSSTHASGLPTPLPQHDPSLGIKPIQPIHEEISIWNSGFECGKDENGPSESNYVILYLWEKKNQ